MAKLLEKLGYVLEGLSAGLQSVGPTTPVRKDTSYGDVVRALSRCAIGSSWKNSILEIIPKDASPEEYEAAIGIINDAGMSGFWKKQSLEKVFGP